MGIYEDDPEWNDVVPIPQDDGGPNALAMIAYTDEYREAMSYLRAVMAANERSERVLELTEHIITMNPAHYTVWLYRADTLKALINEDPQPEMLWQQELIWLNDISLKYLKNYQIWHHRQIIVSQLPSLPSSELLFLARVLAKDVKNYHVWSYRQWLVAHFGLWATSPSSTELAYIESLLRSDIRNNSAWNHRWFVIFGNEDRATQISEKRWEQEIDFAKGKIHEAPQNQSAWNYLKAVVKKRGHGKKELEEFAEQFAALGEGGVVRSSHALDLLAEVWSKGGQEEKEKAGAALGLLAETYDPIRKNYWDYRKSLLGLGTA